MWISRFSVARAQSRTELSNMAIGIGIPENIFSKLIGTNPERLPFLICPQLHGDKLLAFFLLHMYWKHVERRFGITPSTRAGSEGQRVIIKFFSVRLTSSGDTGMLPVKACVILVNIPYRATSADDICDLSRTFPLSMSHFILHQSFNQMRVNFRQAWGILFSLREWYVPRQRHFILFETS